MSEKIVNTIMLLLSTVYLIYARGLSFGSFTYPKVGFIPQLTGTLAVIISSGLLIQAIVGKGDSKNVKLQLDWRKFILIISCITIYIIMLDPIGYLISTFLVLLSVLKIAGQKGVVIPLAISVITTLVFYTVFKIALSIPLPSGILG